MSGEKEVSASDLLGAVSDGTTFEFQGTTYHVEPKALSSKVMRALVRLYDQQLKAMMPELLTALRACKDDDEKDMIKESYGYLSARMEKVQYMLQTDEGVATVLHLCSPQIESFEAAVMIVDEYPSFIDLIRVVTEATGLEAVGN